MTVRRLLVFQLTVAVGAVVLGLGALGGASMGVGWLRAVGLVLLWAGALTAGIVRWKRACRERDEHASSLLRVANEMLAAESCAAAAEMANIAAERAATSRVRNQALTTLAWAALGQGAGDRAQAALDRVDPPYGLDLYCLAAVQSANGQKVKAIGSLELARSSGSLTRDGAKLLVDLYVGEDRMDQAVFAALRSRDLLGADNCNLVLKAARAAGAYGPAGTLASAVEKMAPGLPDVAGAR